MFIAYKIVPKNNYFILLDFTIRAYQSLETLNHHNQIHNDIKPQNYLVKFLDGNNNLNRIEIVLTDFGLAGVNSKGGTPVFASPECLADSSRKDEFTDVFSLGRVFLFLLLPKEQFLEVLFVSLIEGGKDDIDNLIQERPILELVSKMMRTKNRLDLKTIRQKLHAVQRFKDLPEITQICELITNSSSDYTKQYIDNLKHFS